MCSRTRENNKNKAGPVIWDTLYDGRNTVQGGRTKISDFHFQIPSPSVKKGHNIYLNKTFEIEKMYK